MSSRPRTSAALGKHGLARVLSKLGVCSRAQAAELIRAGRVTVNGRAQLDPERRTDPLVDRIELDGAAIERRRSIYLAMNKPRGFVVSTSDEHGRDTIYALLRTASLPWAAPVGRLDKASEGLLLLSNDPEWAAAITDPSGRLPKMYHVQVEGLPNASALAAMRAGVEDRGELLAVCAARILRAGAKNAWLEVVLEEGRNRHLRRLLGALGYPVLRLVRVAIGPVALGSLAKGEWRHLSVDEMEALSTRQALARPPREDEGVSGSALNRKRSDRMNKMNRIRTKKRRSS